MVVEAREVRRIGEGDSFVIDMIFRAGFCVRTKFMGLGC